MTLNVRLEQLLDGRHAFANRKSRVFRRLAAEQPHVVGFQEMSDTMLPAFRAALSDYVFIGARNREAPRKGEYNSVAFHQGSFSLEDAGTFWLSPTPDVAGSRFFIQGPDPRTCTWAELRHIRSGARFRYFNTHLDHLSPIARARGVSVIFSQMEALQRREWLPLFWGGDFNFTPANSLYALCRNRTIVGVPLVDITAAILSSFHWFGRLKRPFKLDYLFTDGRTSKSQFKAYPLRYDLEGRYLSDHDALCAIWTP